jgi:hypothetical protein
MSSKFMLGLVMLGYMRLGEVKSGKVFMLGHFMSG